MTSEAIPGVQPVPQVEYVGQREEINWDGTVYSIPVYRRTVQRETITVGKEAAFQDHPHKAA